MTEPKRPKLVRDYTVIRAQGGLCCGLNEVHGIDNYTDPMASLLNICAYYANCYDGNRTAFSPLKMTPSQLAFAHLIFSQAGDTDYGEKLAELIEAKGLGDVVVSNAKTNPNTSRKITAFIWTVNKTGLCTFWNAALTSPDM